MTGATTTHDNLGTDLAPTIRTRLRAPFSCRAIRQQLLDQCGERSEWEREQYVRRRLTLLDKALTDEEAEALEEWLLCEELLSGKAKVGNYNDSVGGAGKPSLLPDSMMSRLRRHARLKRAIAGQHAEALYQLRLMMDAPAWDYGHAGWRLLGPGLSYNRARRQFVGAVKMAARELCAFFA